MQLHGSPCSAALRDADGHNLCVTCPFVRHLGGVTVPSAAPAPSCCTGGSSQVSPLGEGACFQLLSREVCCPVAGSDLSLVGVLTLPGTRGSIFQDTEDFNLPLLWMVMRPASLSHVLNVEQRWLAENPLVKWRECEKRAGRGWEHLDVGAFLSRSC